MIADEKVAYLFLSLLQHGVRASVISRLRETDPVEVLQMSAREVAVRARRTEKGCKVFEEMKEGFDPGRVLPVWRRRASRPSPLPTKYTRCMGVQQKLRTGEGVPDVAARPEAERQSGQLRDRFFVNYSPLVKYVARRIGVCMTIPSSRRI